MLKNFMHSSASPTDARQPGQARSDASRTGTASPDTRSSESARPVSTTPAAVPEDGNKLIVGPNIKLKGSEITDCEILVVEGRVEASMNSRDIRIAEGGVFSGKAEIDVAEVRGHFEGELTARKRLVIYATGKVSGVIRYGAMMVEEGGTISGDVATLQSDTKLAGVKETVTHIAEADPDQDKPEVVENRFGTILSRNQAGKR